MSLDNSYQIHIDSSNAHMLNSPDNSSVKIILKEGVEIKKNQYCLISACDAQIPISYYLINDSNNTLYFSVNEGEQLSLSILQGNYTASSLLTFLSASILVSYYGFSITYDDSALSFTFSNPQTFIFYGTSTCFKFIGLNSGNYVSSLSGSYYITSDCVIDFSGIRNIYIYSNLNTKSITSGSSKFENILAKIPVTVSYGFLLFWTNFTLYKSMIHDNYLNYFEINIKDDVGNLLNFNGGTWSLTLSVEIYNKGTNETNESNESLGIKI